MKNSLARSLLKTFVPINPSIVAVPLGHVQPSGLVVFLPCDSGNDVLAERKESAHDVLARVAVLQSISPNRIELIQLIVQRVAAIFCYQNRVLSVCKGNIIKCRMVGVAEDD